jgi:internalin A
MKKITIYLFIAFLFLSCNRNSNNSVFDNPDLDKAVRKALNLTDDYNVGQKDLDLITEITCTRWRDLSGLRYLRNLKEIYIVSVNYGFTDISELKYLETLQISGCDITNLNFIDKSINIKYLFVDENKIDDISAVAKLKNLKEFSACHNNIKDISVLSKLTKIEYINIYDNKVENLPDFSHSPNLREIDLQNNKLIYSNNYFNLKQVKVIRLSSNKIDKIDWVASLDSVQDIGLYTNPIDYNAADNNEQLKKMMKEDILHFDTKPVKISWWVRVINFCFE